MLKNVRASLVAAVLTCSVLLPTGCGSSPSTAKSPVTFATASLPNGIFGVAYNAMLQASNGVGPYTFSLASGSMPGGLVLTSAGLLSGTPTGSGTFNFAITVSDAASQRATQSFSISITAVVTLSPSTLPNGTVGTPYTANVTAANGTSPYTYAVSSGKAPDGVSISPSTGAFTGTPTVAGTFTFSVTATDANSQKGTASYTVTIAPLPVSITPATLASGEVGVAYSATIAATNGTTPYTFTAPANSLPGGLTLAANGSITGVPTTAGTTSFQATVTDATGKTNSGSYSITIVPAVSLTAATLPGGVVGAAYTATIAATNGTTPYTFSVPANTLPGGLSISPGTGAITGTASASGTFTFSVTATDAKSRTDTKSYSINIAAAPPTIVLGNANFGAVVNQDFTAALPITGGIGPYTVTRTGGNFPGGTVQLSPSGVFSGKPTTVGTYTFTANITDSSSPQQTLPVSITVNVVDAAVVIDTSAKPVPVPSTFYGLHTSIYDDKLNDYSTLASWLPKTGISVLRYPGGGYADNYHWAQHTITPFNPTTAQPVCGVLSDGYVSPIAHFGTFVKLLQATNTQAIITVNYGTSLADANATRTNGKDGQYNCSEPNTFGQPQEAAAWVAYANGSASNTQVIGKDASGYDWKTVGFWAALRGASPLGSDDGYNFLRIGHSAPIGVKYWEVGNEVYYNGWTNNINAETDMHAPYIYTNGVYDGGFSSRAGLTPLSPTSYGQYAIQFVQAMKAVDSSILVGLDFASPGATDPIDLSFDDSLAKSACSLGAFDVAIIHYYPGTWKDVQPGELLSLPQTDLPYQVAWIKKSLNQYCSNASSIKFMLTETAPNDKLDPAFPAPVMGLFALNNMMAALGQGVQNFDWLELHSHSTVDPYNTYLTDSEDPSYAFYGIQMAYLMAAPGDSVLPATSTSTTMVSYATLKANGQKGLVLINNDSTNAKTVQVTVPGATAGATATQYSYGINTTQSGGNLSTTTFTVPGTSFAVTVPAYTAVELLVP